MRAWGEDASMGDVELSKLEELVAKARAGVTPAPRSAEPLGQQLPADLRERLGRALDDGGYDRLVAELDDRDVT